MALTSIVALAVLAGHHHHHHHHSSSSGGSTSSGPSEACTGALSCRAMHTDYAQSALDEGEGLLDGCTPDAKAAWKKAQEAVRGQKKDATAKSLEETSAKLAALPLDGCKNAKRLLERQQQAKASIDEAQKRQKAFEGMSEGARKVEAAIEKPADAVMEGTRKVLPKVGFGIGKVLDRVLPGTPGDGGVATCGILSEADFKAMAGRIEAADWTKRLEPLNAELKAKQFGLSVDQVGQLFDLFAPGGRDEAFQAVKCRICDRENVKKLEPKLPERDRVELEHIAECR